MLHEKVFGVSFIFALVLTRPLLSLSSFCC